MNILFINACVRKDKSRTLRLCHALLCRLKDNYPTATINQINLETLNLQPLNYDTIEKRNSLLNQKDFSNDMFSLANQFVNADIIVMGTPYYDLSFSSLIKLYIEHVSVNDISFKYAEDGNIIGLSKAKKMFYVTTSGGFIQDNNFGYDYISKISTMMFGITKVIEVKAEGLDIIGANVEDILNSTYKQISKLEV